MCLRTRGLILAMRARKMRLCRKCLSWMWCGVILGYRKRIFLGVTRELGEDAVTTADYFASRKRINHVHYRNVLVVKPYEKYQELFIDAGQNDMFGVMKALVKNKYTGTIYPEHPRALDADRDRVGPGGRIGGYPGGGGYTGITYSVAYARAMMQAALETV